MLGALLLLADSRLPAGGHAHSGGVEAAVAAGSIRDVSTLERFLRGRLATVGRVSAAATAMVTQRCGLAVSDVDDALDARTASPALRSVSRAQGRALLRAGRALWPLPPVHSQAPHQSVALGIVAAAAGISSREAAGVAAYGSVAGPAGAAVRLLGLDPYATHAVLARLTPAIDDLADAAVSTMDGSADDLPAATAPLLDIHAEDHATWEVRLFAS
jgi:urease accessory protein